MHSKLKICIIGNGVHSKRIQKILIKKKLKFSIFKPKIKKNYAKQSLEHLKKFNIIFIVSPDYTHFNYIKKLHKYCYIFCEKPPCTTKKQLTYLKKIKSKKIYYNFDYRFSELYKILIERNKYNLGKFLYANIINTHALALKKEYKDNWRSNKKYSKKGILEVVSVHFIDMINNIFQINKFQVLSLFNNSKYGNSFDNSIIKLTLKNNSVVNIFNSWTSELLQKKIFIFENGSISENENGLTVSGPALNLDKNRFTKPAKAKKKINYNDKNKTNDTLTKSVNYFLQVSSKKKFFTKKEILNSLISNSFIV